MVHISERLLSALQECAGQGMAAATALLKQQEQKKLTNEVIDYIDYRFVDGKLMLSYCPADKEQEETDAGKWTRPNRQIGKIGKVIRKLFTDEPFANSVLTSTNIEVLTNGLYAIFDEGEIEVITGYSITDAYMSDTHEDSGTLKNSCMQLQNEEWFDLYALNPSVCQLAVMWKEDYLYARALLWTLTTGEKFLDRIYGNDRMIAKFIRWAQSNRYLYKDKQGLGSLVKAEAIQPPASKVLEVKLEQAHMARSTLYGYPLLLYTEPKSIEQSKRWLLLAANRWQFRWQYHRNHPRLHPA